MHIDPKANAAIDNYKLLTNLVVPRPIAWVTSQDEHGLVNLAPFSFFNAVGSDPLYIFISVGANDDGSMKDTARNISASGEFVVNMVTEDVLAAMNVSAADFPADQSELTAAGLHVVDSLRVTVPRVAESQASMECRLHSKQASTRRLHDLHWRGGDVSRRRPPDGRTHACQRLCADRAAGIAVVLLPHHRSI